MSKRVWRITSRDGFERDMPGHMSESEITATLQRLVSRHLSKDEIVSASLRRNAIGHSPALERIGAGYPLHYGDDIFYTAQRENI